MVEPAACNSRKKPEAPVPKWITGTPVALAVILNQLLAFGARPGSEPLHLRFAGGAARQRQGRFSQRYIVEDLKQKGVGTDTAREAVERIADRLRGPAS